MTNINARTQFYLDNPNFILSVARKHHIPESDIEDFSQQVLLESLQHRCRIAKGVSLEGYAEGYVLIKIAQHKQNFAKEKLLDMTDFPSRTAPADAILEGAEAWTNVKEQIISNGYKVTETQNRAMELISSGLSTKQTAKEMGVSEVRIRVIRRQIRAKIQKTEKKRGRKRKNYNENQKN